MKNYKIAVAGTGYVGLSLGVLLSQHHQVVAVDIVQAKVDMINNKKSPIQDDYIEKYLAEKDLNLTATLDAKAAYTVAKASQGLADYLKKNYAEPSVAIGYDSRLKSDVFAKVAAGVFAANGVKVNIWPVLIRDNPSSKPAHQCTNQIVIQPVITHSEERIWAGRTPRRKPRVPDAPKIKHDKMKQFYLIDIGRKMW